MSSLYPSQHGAIEKMDPLHGSVTTLAEAFTDAGYWTAGFVTNINVAPIFNFQQGFGEYHYLTPDFYFGASDSATRLSIYKILRVVRERMFKNRIYFQNYYQDADVLNRAVSGWLAESPPQPFHLLIHYMDPHDPYFEIPYNGHGIARVNDPNPPAEDAERLRSLYEEGVDYLDEHLALLIDELKRRDLYDRSVVLITSDHGEEFQDHGGWWHGTTLYEEQMKVPLIIKRAGERQGGTVMSSPARLLDVAPTLLAAAGLTAPATFVGDDLWAKREIGPVYAEEDLEGNALTAVRVGPWKLITANPDNPRGLKEVELYNLEADPAERNDLSQSEVSRVETMMEHLDAMSAEVGAAD
jgi:arylsulfatase A-like enzyme